MSITERMSIPQKSTFNYSLKVKHIFLTFMQEFCSFQNPSHQFYWNKDDIEKSNIYIFDSYSHDIETYVGKKPALVLKRGPIYVSSGTMYENMLRFENKPSNIISKNGHEVPIEIEYKTFLFSGNVDWHCISRQGLEAEHFASNVAMLHQAYKQVLREKGLYDIKSIQIGEETMIEGDVETEMVMVPVTIAYDLQAHYEIWSDAAIFERANIIGEVDSNNNTSDILMNTDP